MLFNSTAYVFFLPIVVCLYYVLPARRRWILLLLASYYFYMSWRPVYVVLIAFSTLVDYFAAQAIAKAATGPSRRLWLAASLAANLGLLGVFKYWNFAADSIRWLVEPLSWVPPIPAADLLLPVGISFYTFQSLSYTIDVYRGARPPERHLGIFALYVVFFPQLVAGPIERSTTLLPQLLEPRPFSTDNLAVGFRLILRGFFKKLVVADRLAIYVDAVYSNPDGHSGVTLLVATLCFAFQIYCDFSGYSDIAVGSARLMGYKLMANFRRPYFAASVGEFWSRWHISLSTWFRDYLYIPLGGNRKGFVRRLANVAVVFTVSGLWHGANWTFVVWGALHSLYLIFELLSARLFARLAWSSPPRIVTMPLTFVAVVVAWVFFRAATLSEALTILARMVTAQGSIFLGPFGGVNLVHGVVAVAAIVVVEAIAERQDQEGALFLSNNPAIRLLSYAQVAAAILLFGVFDGGQFIYFQF